jgi:hypothetical protein
MKLLDVITAAGGRVSGGDPYLWNCYGDDAQFMEFRDVDGQGYSHCIFDTKTYRVYEVYAEVPLGTNEAGAPPQIFRWINPLFLQEYLDECKIRNEDPNIAYDDVKHNDIPSEQIILEYVKDIGEGYYDNLPLPTEPQYE